MTAGLQYFTVNQPLYEVVETNTTIVGDNTPTVIPISGTLTFTPCDATGKALPEIVSSALDMTVMLDPIEGRFNVDMTTSTYTAVTGDTWASIVAKVGGLGLTVATLQAANTALGTGAITAGTAVAIPAVDDGALRSLNNALGVALVDNQNLDLAAGGLVYRGDYSNVNFDDIGERRIASVYFAAPGDGSTIDLNTVTRLAL